MLSNTDLTITMRRTIIKSVLILQALVTARADGFDDWDLRRLDEEHLVLPKFTPSMAGETKRRRAGGTPNGST